MLACVHPNAAALDIGSAEIVAVPSDRDRQPVRVFATFTPDLAALVDWLVACHIETVAMESTGVYWVPMYELLEQRGIIPYLVNAHHAKTVPGGRAIGTMRNGSSAYIRSACYMRRFAPTPIFAPYAR